MEATLMSRMCDVKAVKMEDICRLRKNQYLSVFEQFPFLLKTMLKQEKQYMAQRKVINVLILSFFKLLDGLNGIKYGKSK